MPDSVTILKKVLGVDAKIRPKTHEKNEIPTTVLRPYRLVVNCNVNTTLRHNDKSLFPCKTSGVYWPQQRASHCHSTIWSTRVPEMGSIFFLSRKKPTRRERASSRPSLTLSSGQFVFVWSVCLVVVLLKCWYFMPLAKATGVKQQTEAISFFSLLWHNHRTTHTSVPYQQSISHHEGQKGGGSK